VGSQEIPKGMATDCDVGLFVVMVDSSGKINKTTSASFDDFRGGTDIASANLDLRFDGTGPGHDVDVTFAGNFAAHSLDFADFPGKVSFNANTLTLSGGLKLSPAMGVNPGTGTIAFTGTGTDNLFLRANDTLPALRKTGSGKLVLQNAGLSAQSLRIEGGAIDFNNNSADLGGFVSTGGSLEGLGADDSLLITGGADFSGLTAFTAPVGNIIIKAFGSGTAAFNPGGKTFPKLTLTTWPVTAKTTLAVGPGSLSVLNNLVLRNRLNASGFDGAVDFRSAPAVSVEGDILQLKEGTGTSRQTVLLGNGTWTVLGNVNVSLEAGGSGDSAVFRFGKASGTQTLAVSNGALFAVEHVGAGILKLANALSAARLTQSAGGFDFGGFDLALKGNLRVENGGPKTLIGLGGRTLTVDGDAAFIGKASGDSGTGLGINPSAAWRIKVKGALTADSCDVGNSDATGFSKGVASKGSNNLGKNLNWEFWQAPAPPVVTRDPADVTAKPGWKVSFSLAAEGSGPLHFEWRRQGDTAVLSRDTVLILDSVKASQNGYAYYCVASNPLGQDTTRQALLLVRDCDSSFTPPPDFNAVEGGRVTLKGKSGCATEVLWSPVSGPVPKLFDPQVDTLVFDAPRVPRDTTLVLQYSARYGTAWESRNVSVKVKDTIPDPAASLDPQAIWDGQGAKILKARIGNSAALALFPKYPLRYLWSVEPLIADTAQGGDSLSLRNPQDNGNVEVTVCADNGGTPSCPRIVLEIQRITTSLLWKRAQAGPVGISGGRLAWNRTGLVRIMDWRGRILWERWGTPGSSAQLPTGAERSLRIGAARMDFLSPTRERSFPAGP
jgi:hypothetical protein